MIRNGVLFGITIILVDILMIYFLIYSPFADFPLPVYISLSSGPIYKFDPLDYARDFPVSVNESSLTSNNPHYIFIYNSSGKPIEDEILHLLSLNASLISPSTYWTIADLAGFFSNYTIGKNFSVYYLTPYYYDNYSEQPNVSEIYLNISDVYASPFIVTYPPSDQLNYSFEYNVHNLTYVQSFAITWLSYVKWYSTQPPRAIVWRYSAIFNVLTFVEVNGQFYYQGYKAYIICVTVNGVSPSSITVNIKYPFHGRVLSLPIIINLSTSKNIVHRGNTTILSPTFPPNVQTIYYRYTFYDYNVSLPINVSVFNGTSPTTFIISNNSIIYSTNARNFSRDVQSSMWSYSPYIINVSLATKDIINIGENKLIRQWDPGYIMIVPSAYSIVRTEGNVIDIECLLNFTIQDHILKSPPNWVFNHIPSDYIYKNNYANKYLQYIGYYYGLNRLLNSIIYNFTTNITDERYSNWELLVLASEISMQIISNSTASNYTVALISKEGSEYQAFMQLVFIVSWNIWYSIYNGSYYLVNKWHSWEYGLFTGFNVPPYYLGNKTVLPYFVLNYTNTSYLLYNTASLEITSWFYTNISLNGYNLLKTNDFPAFSPIPTLRENIEFHKYYQFTDIPIFIHVINQNFTITSFNI